MSKASMQDFLGIKLVKVERGYMEATMPVNERTKQPFGYLHGGANVVLAETVASLGSYELIDQTTELCFGLEINANHLRSKQDGFVTAKATIHAQGKTVHVWDIRIFDEANNLLCISRCSVAVKKKR